MLLKKNSEDNVITLDIDVIKKKIVENIRKPLKTVEDLERYFSTWFCLHYNLPYKTKILEDYTLTDLIYEYYDILFRTSSKELEEYAPLEDKKKALEEDEEWLKKQEGDDYISAEEQSKMLEEAHKSIIRPEITTDAHGNPIVAESDGLPEDFKRDFDIKE